MHGKRGTWRKRPIVALLSLCVLVALGIGIMAWAAAAQRHKASTYGVTDPSRAALRVENRTTDFAIARIAIEEGDGDAVVEDLRREIGTDAAIVVEIPPGDYLVTVWYVETKQIVLGRPEGDLSGTIAVSPGRAVHVRLEGGRSSPESPFFIPPELAID